MKNISITQVERSDGLTVSLAFSISDEALGHLLLDDPGTSILLSIEDDLSEKLLRAVRQAIHEELPLLKSKFHNSLVSAAIEHLKKEV